MATVYLCGFNGFHQIDTVQRVKFRPDSAECKRDDSKAVSLGGIGNENDKQCTHHRCGKPIKIGEIGAGMRIIPSWSRLYITSNTKDLVRCIGGEASRSNEGPSFSEGRPYQDERKILVDCGKTVNLLSIKLMAVGGQRVIAKETNEESAGDHLVLEETADNAEFKLLGLIKTRDLGDLDFSIGDSMLVGMGKDCLISADLRERSKCTGLDMPEGTISVSELEVGFKISKVTCGKEHAVLLSEGGLVLTYGLGSRGQLGHGSTDPYAKPHVVEMLEPLHIVAIAAGGWHTMALADTGDIYSWGWNESGQLGIALSPEFEESGHGSSSASSENTPPLFQAFPCLIGFPCDVTVTNISCGSRHSAAASDIGHLWTWGWNKYGQLGHDDFQNRDRPIRCQYFYDNGVKVREVVCRCWTTVLYCSVADST